MVLELSDSLKQAKNRMEDTKPFVWAVTAKLSKTEKLHITDNNASFFFDGFTHTPANITIGDIRTETTGTVEGVSITLGNVKRELSIEIRKRRGLEDMEVLLTRVYDPSGTIEKVVAQTFTVKGVVIDDKKQVAVFRLGRNLLLTAKFPKNSFYHGICRFAYTRTGTGRCGYNGPLTECDRGLITPNGCAAHNNSSRYGGFWSVPLT